MVVVSRGHFPSQATTDEHRAPVPHVPTPARLELITLASGTSAHLRGDRQPWMKHCSTSALAAPQPTGGRGTPSYHLQHREGVLVWLVSERSVSSPRCASSARAPRGGRRKACGVRGLDAGFRLDVSGTRTADDKMLEPGGRQELPLAFGSTCVTLYRATDYTQVLQPWGGTLQSISSSGYYLRSQQYQLQDSLIR